MTAKIETANLIKQYGIKADLLGISDYARNAYNETREHYLFRLTTKLDEIIVQYENRYHENQQH